MATVKGFNMIKINIGRMKSIAHVIRREVRSIEFEPLDKLATVPSLAQDVERQREEIRTKYVAIQNEIDNASNEDDISLIVDSLRVITTEMK